MKNQVAYLQHIMDAIEQIEEFSKDHDWENAKTERAIERCIEIIGEAANKLSKEFQKKFSEIEWELIIGMRHKLIHDYFDVNPDIVRATVEYDIPALKQQVKKILQELE